MWDEILVDLKNRGLKKTGLVVIDDLTGLDCAIERHFNTRVQKCVLHLKRNILKKVRKTDRYQMAEDLAYLFNLDEKHDDQEEFTIRAKWLYDKWSKKYAHLSLFNKPDKLHYYCTYLDFETEIRNMIYTTNWIERLNKAFKRTLKIRNSMPSVESVMTLLSKVAIDMNNNTYQYPVSRFTKSKLFD